MEVGFTRVVPILRIFDIEKARQFYVDYLGFTVDWEHRFSEEAPCTRRCRGATWCFTSRSTTATARPAREHPEVQRTAR
jgi:catechol 2,3-dioxygenase-like lactoylglutathione lyase family enzyme